MQSQVRGAWANPNAQRTEKDNTGPGKRKWHAAINWLQQPELRSSSLGRLNGKATV